MTTVLNPYLYRNLARKFGTPIVTSAGEKMLSKAVTDFDDNKRLEIDHPGEYYKICCPYCRDTRNRLYVNHMFGKRDEHGRKINYLAVCYNEGCLSDPENLANFIDELDETGLLEARIREGVVISEEAREVTWPGVCVDLTKLKRNDPAIAYLHNRGFDPVELSTKFHVKFCIESNYSLARNRLIIPVFDHDKLKGWQARYVGELDWKGPDKRTLPPKYFSCPGSNFRSKCILNFSEMKKWATGVIVEGPTDVFRFGSMSGCIFGNSMTEAQRRKFVTVFRDRSGVLLLDPEEYESKSTTRLLNYFKEVMPNNFCAVKLPDGTDPGSLDRDTLKAYVKAKAAEQGVRVSYKKVVKK